MCSVAAMGDESDVHSHNEGRVCARSVWPWCFGTVRVMVDLTLVYLLLLSHGRDGAMYATFRHCRFVCLRTLTCAFVLTPAGAWGWGGRVE